MSRHKPQVQAGQLDFFALQSSLFDEGNTPAEQPKKMDGFATASSMDVLVAGAKAKVLANLEAVKTLYAIESDDRLPTAQEMAVLARYSAFGGSPKAFDDRPSNSEKVLYDLVSTALTPADFKSAKASTPNAFYTTPEIINAMWRYVVGLGFTGGRILEPAAATGLFIAGMPKEIRAASEVTAVELDRLSGRIGQALHPDVKYHLKGLQEAELLDGYFDLSISNIPFGDYKVYDASFTREENELCGSIHNYFFIKAVRVTRPGGLIAFVTSRYMLDAKNDAVRAYLGAHCRLVGAVRLPSHTFTKFSGTDVVTDIVFFQKLDEGRPAPPTQIWLNAGKVLLSGGKLTKEEFWINEYFLQKSKRIMGDLRCRTGAFAAQLSVEGSVDPDTFAERILEHLPAYDDDLIYKPVAHTKRRGIQASNVPFTDVRDGSFGYMDLGGVRTVYQKISNEAIPVTKKRTNDIERLVGMIDLVTAARNVLAQCIGGDDEELAESQAQLSAQYDKFVADFGYLSGKANRYLFADDPNATFLLALEIYDPETKTAKKTKLFTQRTVRAHARPTSAATASDALALSLNEYGSLNMAYMQDLYGKSAQEIIDELGGTIYYDPAKVGWVTSDEYLSGDVVQKLKEALATEDPDLDRNVAALLAIQPTRLLPEQITASLGSTWIPAKYISQFVLELVDPTSLANNIDVTGHSTKHSGKLRSYHWFTVEAKYIAAASRWVVTPNYRLRGDDNVSRKWGTSRRDMFDLLESQLNGTKIEIFDTVDENRVLNDIESIAAREKAAEIGQLFRRWAWMDTERAADLCKIYNDTFRSMVERKYDGSYMTFPNTSLDLPEFHAHQRNAIARAILGGNMLLWHAVGAGKTWSMIVSAMEMKRLGLRNKPIHVVPGNLLEQYAVEFYRVYPNARILVINAKKMSPQEKQVSLARIATEDWDSILITHSSFQKIPLGVESWEWLINQQVEELEEAIDELKDDDGNRFSVKRMEAKKLGLQARLQQRKDRLAQDKTGLTFEQLGIDMILVDEFHTYKSLYYLTAREHIAGIGGRDSGIAYDMFVKSQYVTRRCEAGHILGERRNFCTCGAANAPAGSLIGATGTAITNSIAEMYTLQRFFQMDLLIDKGVDAFDGWAGQFGTSKWVVEMEASGKGWRTKERFVEFVNVPELLLLFRQVADICIDQNVLRLKRPALFGGAPKAVEIKPSPELLAFIDECAARAAALKDKKPWEDNMLAIMGASGRASTDLRLVDIMVDDENSKINTAVRNVFKIWQETSAVVVPGLADPVGMAQLVFLDVGVPDGAGFPLYQDMKDKWIALGVPENQIAFAHDAKTDTAKKELYNAVNQGKIRIILGTTGKLGAGVNMQRLLHSLHHLDAPWTPALMEQREGRIRRPGNLNPSVWIFRYTVVNSLDFHKWHLLELKANSNAQLFIGDSEVRSVEDLDQAVIDFASMRAMSTGNPLIMEQVSLRANLNRLHALHDKYYNDRRRAIDDSLRIPGDIQWHTERRDWCKEAIVIRGKFTEKPDLIVQGQRYEKRAEAAKHFQALVDFKVRDEVLDMGYAQVSVRAYNERTFARIVIGPATIDAEMGDSGIGNLTRIDNEIDALPKTVAVHEMRIRELGEKQERLKIELSRTFDKQDEMEKAQSRLQEINAELANLAKNDTAAAAAVVPEAGSEPSEDTEASETEE